MPKTKSTSKQTSQNLEASKLSPDEILTAEFDYIAASAFQANEDRSKAASFFLVAVGSLVAAIFGAQQITNADEVPAWVFQVLGLLFLILTIFGYLTIAQLARLRLAWHDAAIAMNKIKQHYVDHTPGLNSAFHWRSDTLPKKLKFGSISFYTVLEVSLLSGLTGAASMYCFISNSNRGGCSVPITVAVGFFVFLFGPISYRILLRE